MVEVCVSLLTASMVEVRLSRPVPATSTRWCLLWRTTWPGEGARGVAGSRRTRGWEPRPGCLTVGNVY